MEQKSPGYIIKRELLENFDRDIPLASPFIVTIAPNVLKQRDSRCRTKFIGNFDLTHSSAERFLSAYTKRQTTTT